MANKNFENVRIRTKRDTSANWELNNPVLLNGEEILVDTNAGEVRKKVGNGTKTYSELPFSDEPLRTLIGNKVDKVTGKGLSTEDYTTAEKTKLNGIATGANNYVHPSNHDATMITEDTTHRFVTDAEKTAWNAKASTAIATTAANGLMSKDDKTKLDGIATGAEVNQNAFSNIKVGDSTVIADAKTDTFELVPGANVTITAVDDKITIASTNTEYQPVTTSKNGLMISTDKAKLDGIEEGANKYTHPATHAATMITEDTTHRFVTDTEKATWNGKANSADLTSHTGNTSNPHSVNKTQVGLGNVTNDSQVKRSEMGVASGVATLDTNGKVPSSQLPSYVDDVIEGYLYNSKLYKEAAHTTEISGESGKIYIDLDTEKTYRWTGTVFGVISETIALGETSATAYAGDKGKANATAISTIQTKLSGIEEGANKYVHPSTHAATMITEDTTHRFVTDTEKTAWNAKASTAVATTTANGLMSKEDKASLDDILTRLAAVETKIQSAIYYAQ